MINLYLLKMPLVPNGEVIYLSFQHIVWMKPHGSGAHTQVGLVGGETVTIDVNIGEVLESVGYAEKGRGLQ